jgi:5-methylcytosine-specific restriction endonuclease McrA
MTSVNAGEVRMYRLKGASFEASTPKEKMFVLYDVDRVNAQRGVRIKNLAGIRHFVFHQDNRICSLCNKDLMDTLYHIMNSCPN